MKLAETDARTPEVKVINSRIWMCHNQECDGVHHYYKAI